MVNTSDHPTDPLPDDPSRPMDDDIEWVSKSEMKREMLRFQTLAKQLIKLPNNALDSLGLSEPVLAAIREARRLKKDDAVNRQIRHIARQLQQAVDIDELQRKVALFDANSPVYAQMTQLTERWRDDLVADTDALARFFDDYPNADRQHLGQLVRNARKAMATHQQSATSAEASEPVELQQKKRKLFQALRDAIEEQHQR